MAIKLYNAQELSELDKQISSYKENDWNYLDVVVNEDTNFEYYNEDISSISAKNIRKENLKYIGMVATGLVAVFTLGLGGVGYAYTRFKAPNSVQATSTSKDLNATYINGKECDSETLIKVASVLSAYFQLFDQQAFSRLDEYCVATSDFNQVYNEYKNQIVENFDTYDCYARSMNILSKTITFVSVDKVIYNDADNCYYTYININLPTDANIEEYSYLLQYNTVKHFSNAKVTEHSLQQYLINNIDTTSIETTNLIWCIKLDENFKIISDKQLSDKVNSIYTTILTNTLQYLSGALTSD